MKLNENKKIIYGICVFLVVFAIVIFFLNQTFALKENNLLVECPDSEFSIGKNISCNLKVSLEDDVKIYAVGADLELGEGLTFQSFVPKESFTESTFSSDSKLIVGSRSSITDGEVLGTLTLSANLDKKNYQFSLLNIQYSDENNKLIEVDNVKVNLPISIKNPTTGVISLIFILIMLFSSIVCFNYFSKKYKKQI